MKTCTTKKSVAERKAELELQLAELDILADVEEQIQNFIGTTQNNIQSTLETTRVIGKETTQATNYKGELLFNKDGYGRWSAITEAERAQKFEEEQALYLPYYADVIETIVRDEKELSEWERRQLTVYKRVLAILEGVEL